MAIGFTVPFTKSSGSIGYFETTDTELAAVRENLKSLLVTNFGERVMHYNFGCNLVEFLFEQQHGNELRERITDRIDAQLKIWMPFVAAEQIDVVFSDEDPSLPDHAIGVMVKFHLVSKPELNDRLNFAVTP